MGKFKKPNSFECLKRRAVKMNLVFSGVQPTGNLHLGNYLGAVRNWVSLQNKFDCAFCIVDMHAITVWQDPAELIANTREVTAALIAAGINPKTQILFNQSRNPDHANLSWVLNCVSRLGWLNRMTQFIEKAGKDREKASVGLYTYPNLMAADILAYKATHVPVGEDQKQHLELARDIAKKFNNDYGLEVFPLPEPLIMGAATRVMSLRDGTNKMSKSDPSDLSRINLSDSADTVAQKIRKAKTDPYPLPDSMDSLVGRPEAENLISIYAALSNMTREEALLTNSGKQFAVFKRDLTEITVSVLEPINKEMRKLLSEQGHIDEILVNGAERARAISEPILKEVYQTVGFYSN